MITLKALPYGRATDTTQKSPFTRVAFDIFARTKIKVRSFNCRGYFVQKAKLARKRKLDYYLSAAQPFF